MPRELPLPALLSGPLVAFTIELDNEFEHGFQYRTALRKARGEPLRGPWLTSIVMWANCLRYVGDDGTTVDEVARRARTHANIDGVRRWGYVTVDGHGRGHAYEVGRVKGSSILRLTKAGQTACARWEPLPGAIEDRWRERFGAREVDRLRAALLKLITGYTHELPDCLPILGYGLFCRGAELPRRDPGVDADRDLPLWSLLSRALLSFALTYERETALSLAVMANVVRVLDGDGVPAAELPRITGVSKEAIAMALKLLAKGHLTEVRSVRRRRIVALTDRGAHARELGLTGIAGVETAWRRRFGAAAIDELRAALHPLAGDLRRDGSPLFGGLEPNPDGWRAQSPEPETLPWFPMVLHRGGWPDGS